MSPKPRSNWSNLAGCVLGAVHCGTDGSMFDRLTVQARRRRSTMGFHLGCAKSSIAVSKNLAPMLG